MKKSSTLLRSPELESNNQMQFSVKTKWVECLPMAWETGVQSQVETGTNRKCKKKNILMSVRVCVQMYRYVKTRYSEDDFIHSFIICQRFGF